MKKFAQLFGSVLAVLTAGSILAACATVEGVGEDVETVGENVSEAARDVAD